MVEVVLVAVTAGLLAWRVDLLGESVVSQFHFFFFHLFCSFLLSSVLRLP